MKITLIFVSSVDGKSTRGDQQPYLWASPEDQTHFFNLINQSKLIVMGRETYESSRPVIKLRQNCLRVVLTSQLEHFSNQVVSGQLEFSDESPIKLVQRLIAQGYQEMTLVGGAKIAAAFINQGLVSEIVLTTEPALFGTGRPLLDGLKTAQKLKLRSVQKLNDHGTLLLKYSFQE